MPETRKKVLLVDDQGSTILTLRFQVNHAGFDILTASSGDEALKIIATDRPDLIMLDVMMPLETGFQVCRRLKDDPATKEIPVFIVTSLHGDSDSAVARTSGANEFFTKPLKTEELVKMLRKYLGSPFKM
jgi:two-component system cell cycle response regulator